MLHEQTREIVVVHTETSRFGNVQDDLVLSSPHASRRFSSTGASLRESSGQTVDLVTEQSS